jgi:methionine-rich copper-binding protein CopC
MLDGSTFVMESDDRRGFMTSVFSLQGAKLLVVAVVAAALLALGWLAPGRASADALLESEPPADEVVGEAPEALTLTFDRPLLLEPGVNSVAIVDAQGVRVDDGAAELSTFSARTMVARLAEGVEPEGTLEVVYVVRFADSGDEVTGRFGFTIEPGAEPEAHDVAADVAGEPRGTESIVLWTIVILLAVALFGLLLFYLRVATDNARSSLEPPDDPSH